jgi:hypothetical protein
MLALAAADAAAMCCPHRWLGYNMLMTGTLPAAWSTMTGISYFEVVCASRGILNVRHAQ